jgi:hypothetical protein
LENPEEKSARRKPEEHLDAEDQGSRSGEPEDLGQKLARYPQTYDSAGQRLRPELEPFYRHGPFRK